MCCFSYLHLDPWQTWISFFHLHLHLHSITPPVCFALSFSGHPCWLTPTVLREKSMRFFSFLLEEISVLSYSSLLCWVSLPLEWILLWLHKAHLEGVFPWMFGELRVSGQRVPEADWGRDASDLHPALCLFQPHKHFLAYYSVINPNLVNFKHSSLSRK